MNALTEETKAVQWPAGGDDKVRLSATVAEVLDTAKPVNLSKGDFLIQSAIQRALMVDILGWDLWRVYRRVGKLLGIHGSDGKPLASRTAGTPNGKSLPSREVECPQCGTHFVAKAAGIVLAVLLAIATPAAAQEFYAFAPTFTGGVHVALCGGPDVYGNRWLVVGAGPGWEPRVNAYIAREGIVRGPLYSWNAYHPDFRGGVTVACTVLDGITVVVTGAGPGGGPHVRLWWLP